MEVRACAGGGSPVPDPTTGAAMDCGSGPHRRDCPPGSYCHHALDAARCCTRNETKPVDDKSPCSGASCSEAAGACACNRLGAVSERCEAGTRSCACRPGVGGHKCDRCEPGYWGLAHLQPAHDQRAGCTPCGCSVFGSVREDCEQMTGRCVCKAGVQGHKCTVCINDTQILGPNGCYTPDRPMEVPATCGYLVCYYGAVCVEGEERAACECPAASCPSDTADESHAVCGSDGKTYHSECHLKLQACRTQEDIVLQAFGACQLEDPSGTALPAKPYSPLHFTQQDDVNSPSKSTRHLLLPDPRYYYKSELMKKGTPSDMEKSSGANKAPQRPTAATSGAVGALLGDLCSAHGDCAALPGALCRGAACQCREGYEPAQDRKGCLPTTTKASEAPTEEYSACISEPCVNLGTCIDLPDSTYMCVCDALYTGLNCEVLLVDSDIGNFIEVPSFDGNSFIRLKPLKAYHKLNFDVEFKTLSDNGLIVYNQQRLDGTGDFVSLAVVNGFVVFRYDLGDGIVTLRSPERISLRDYHKISAKRYHRDGILSVDSMEDVVGQSAGSLKALDLLDDTYVGSVQTNYSRVYENIGTRQGLTGCVKYLRLIRHQVTKKLGRLDSPVLSMERVRECGSNPCISMPCQNGATCQPHDLSTTQYTCTCAGGYSGQRCEERFDPCESNPCGDEDGVLCDVTSDGSYVCKCLFGTQVGQKKGVCNNEINGVQTVTTPKFNGSSYVELPRLEGLARAFRIEMWILTHRLSGMLFYTGQSTKAKGDFVAINLVNGYLQFRFNLGSGIANITYPHKITKDRWHRVRASRVERHGSLQLDELPVHKGHSVPPLTELNLELPVFIGSLPSYIKPHKLSGLTSSFIGAIQQVFVNGSPLTLYSDDMATCRIAADEETVPCATTGVVPYSGPPCSAEMSPCQNGATCVPVLNEYRCACSEAFTGRNCDTRLVDVIGVNVPLKFVGDNYYAYRNRGRRRKNVDRGIRYEIKFRTHNESGLLMWRRKSGARADDFLAVGLSHAHLHFVYSDRDDHGPDQLSLGRSGPGQSGLGQPGPAEHWFKSVRFPRRVDDGLWHTVVVKRRKRMAMIQLDNHSPLRGFSQSSMIVTKANPKVWIGGAPSLPLGLPAPLYVGLRGCVASIKTNGRHIDLNAPIGRSGDIQRCN